MPLKWFLWVWNKWWEFELVPLITVLKLSLLNLSSHVYALILCTCINKHCDTGKKCLLKTLYRIKSILNPRNFIAICVSFQIFSFGSLFSFETVLLCSAGWPWTYGDPSASASQCGDCRCASWYPAQVFLKIAMVWNHCFTGLFHDSKSDVTPGC